MITCNNTCPEDRFEGCCYSCPTKDDCKCICDHTPDACGDVAGMDEESALVIFQSAQLDTIQQITTVVQAKKAAEEQEKVLKATLFSSMERFGVKKFESDVLNLTYVAPTNTTSVDSTKLKKQFPDAYTECSKTTPKAGYVKIVLKGGADQDGAREEL